jgi:uncharacterized membrane protein
MPELIPFFLFLHVLGAIIAFGPSFLLPYLSTRAGREPQHANFMARASVAAGKGIIFPVALSMAVTGGLIMWSAGIDPMAPAYRWLLLAIGLYVFALLFSLLVQTPTGQRIVELTSGPPPGASGPPPGAGGSPTTGSAPAAGGPPPAPAGPPPELLRSIRRARLGGFILMGLVIAIAFLMVVKPQLGA